MATLTAPPGPEMDSWLRDYTDGHIDPADPVHSRGAADGFDGPPPADPMDGRMLAQAPVAAVEWTAARFAAFVAKNGPRALEALLRNSPAIADAYRKLHPKDAKAGGGGGAAGTEGAGLGGRIKKGVGDGLEEESKKAVVKAGDILIERFIQPPKVIDCFSGEEIEATFDIKPEVKAHVGQDPTLEDTTTLPFVGYLKPEDSDKAEDVRWVRFAIQANVTFGVKSRSVKSLNVLYGKTDGIHKDVKAVTVTWQKPKVFDDAAGTFVLVHGTVQIDAEGFKSKRSMLKAEFHAAHGKSRVEKT